MSAAAICAMAIANEEAERRRRENDPDYEPLCSVGALMDCSWAGPILLIIAVLFSASMLWMSFN